MTMTKNAVGNLIARYKTVLQNCSLMNRFGSLAAAVVVAGAVVLGGASGALAGDAITADTEAEGNNTGVTESYNGGAILSDKTYGEWKLYGGYNNPTATGDTVETSSSLTTDITAVDGYFDEIIGGNYYKEPTTTYDETTVSIGNTKVTVAAEVDGVQYIIGGSKANAAAGTFTTGTTTVDITGGTDATLGMAIGGSYAKAGGNETTAVNTTMTTGATSLTIDGGTFEYAGSTKNVEVCVVGGSVAEIWSTSASTGSMSTTDESTSLIIKDGTFNDAVVGAGFAFTAGSASTATATVTGAATTTITGGTFNSTDVGTHTKIGPSLVAGGYAYGAGSSSTVGSTVLEISSDTDADGAYTTTFASQVIGGGFAYGDGATANVASADDYAEGYATYVSITGGTFGDNIVAGGYAQGSNANNTYSYANVYGNTYLEIVGTIDMSGFGGDIVGGGNASRGQANVYGNTTVVIGADVTDVQGNVYGGGMANGNTSVSDGDSTLTSEANVTGSTTVTISGKILESVFGGGRARSQTEDATANVTENTNVTIADGASVNGVVGGGWAQDYKGEGTATANVDGNTYVTIDGTVNSFGNAYTVASKTSAGIYLSDGTLSVAVVGGGVASGYTAANAVANVTGSTNVVINEGAVITGDVVGGGMVYVSTTGSYGTATVGSTNVTINGGTITGDIYAGGYVDGSAADASSADVTGTATLNIYGGTFTDTSLYGCYSNVDGLSTLNIGSGTGTTSFSFVNIEAFDVVNINSGSTVELTADTFTVDSCTVTIAADASLTANEITLNADGIIWAGEVTYGGTTYGDTSNGGTLTVTTFTNTDNAGTIYVYNAEYTETELSALQTKFGFTTSTEDAANAYYVGTLVDASGDAVDLTATAGSGGAIAAAADSEDTYAGSTTVATGNTLTVAAGSVTAGDNDTANLTASTGLGTVKEVAVTGVDSDATSVDLSLSGTTTLVGDGSGTLLSATNANGEAVDTSITVSGTTLNVGLEGNSQAQGGTVDTVTLTSTGTLNVASNATLNADNVTFGTDANGAEANIAGDATIGTMSFDTSSTAEANITGTTTVAELTGASGATINVGDSSSAGTLIVSSATLGGATVFLDPAWVDGVEIEGASKAAFVFDGEIDGKLIVGQNSFLVLGTTETEWAETAFADAELTWGSDDITAALFIYESQEVTSAIGGSIIVNGSLTTTDNLTYTAGNAYFANNSLLAVNASAGTGESAALDVTTITIDTGAYLLIVDGTAGEDVKVVTIDGTSAPTDVWSTVMADTSLLTATGDWDSTTYTVTLEKVEVADLFGGTTMDTALYGLLAADGSENNSFIKTATSSSLGLDEQGQAKAIESATKLAAASGVAPALGSVNTSAVTNIQTRTGTAEASKTANYLAMNGDGGIVPAGKAQEGFGIWVMPMYNHTSTDGFDSGNSEYGYDTDLYGATLGLDYTFASSLRLGVAFNMGSGESESTGDFHSTENEFDYYGVSLYAAQNFGKFDVSFDLGYVYSDNEIDQDNGAGSLAADVDAGLVTAGIKGEYRATLSDVNVIPYLGLRVNHYMVDGYDTKDATGTFMHTDSADHTIVELPLGVKFDKDFALNDWEITPSLALGAKISMGDLDPDQEVSFTGVAGKASLSSEVADPLTFQGALGLGFKSGAVSFDLGYSLDISEHVESHGVNAMFRYEF